MARWRRASGVVCGISLCLALWIYCNIPEQESDESVADIDLPQGHFIRSAPLGRPHPGLAVPRVLCLVMTSPQHHQGRAQHVMATWGHGGRGACPSTVFISSEPHPALQNVIISSFSGYEALWGKVLEGFRAVNSSSADWFLKADDDTFIVFPHLLTLLSSFDPSRPLYLGLPLLYRPEAGKEVTYMSGGAGYVLSRAALSRLEGATGVKECRYPGYTQYEDVNMGLCMAALGVGVADTRDSLGRPRFLPYPPWRLLAPHPDFEWLKRLSKYEFQFGAGSLSDQVVSFHEIRNAADFYVLQYLIHHLRPLPPGNARPFTPTL